MKVLVGCPTYEGKAYVLNAYAEAVKELDHDDYDVLLVDNSLDDDYAGRIEEAGLSVIRCEPKGGAGETLIESRNLLREHALENGYDYFLSLEQDVVPEPHTLKRLLSHGKDFVTTIVMNYKVVDGERTIVPMLAVDREGHPGKLRHAKMADLVADDLIEVKQAHLACTLLSRKILEKFPFRQEGDASDDTCLAEDMRDAGMKLWCDTTLKPKHSPDGEIKRS